MFHVEQDTLDKALAMVSRVIQPQTALAVLAGIQLDAHDDHITLTATDLFTWLQVTINAQVTRPGTTVLPARILPELVHRIAPGSISIDLSADGTKATVRYGRNYTTIYSYGAERLPECPRLTDATTPFTLDPAEFPRLARQLIFACAKDEARPILKGIAVTLEPGAVHWTASDGSRLSHRTMPLPDYHGPSQQVVMPAKALAEAARVGDHAKAAQVTISSRLIQITIGPLTIVSRLLDGQYPGFQRVMPQDYAIQGYTDLTSLRGAIERANLLASQDRSPAVRLRHHAGQLDILAAAAELGQATESLEFVGDGPDMELLFNPSFLLDALRSLDGSEVWLEFSGIQSPLRIRSADDAQYFHIVLPLRQLT